jgi:integrase
MSFWISGANRESLANMMELFLIHAARTFTPNSLGEVASIGIVRSILDDFAKALCLLKVPVTDVTAAVLWWIQCKAPLSTFDYAGLDFIIRFCRFAKYDVDAPVVRLIARKSLRPRKPKIAPEDAESLRTFLLKKAIEQSGSSFASQRTAAIVGMMLFLPLRRGTIKQLRFASLDMKAETLEIGANMMKNRDPMIVQLPSPLVTLLARYVETRGNEPGFLYPLTPSGHLLNEETLSKSIKRTTARWFQEEEIDIKGLSPHSFRHIVGTFSSVHWGESAAKALLGITSDRTLKHYNLSTAGMRASAALRRLAEELK